MLTPRDYQVTAARDIWRNLIIEKHGSCLLQAPTGSGKTATGAFVVKKMLEHKGIKTLCIAHRREIVTQTARRLRDDGLSTGIIMAGELYTPNRDIQVASVDTLDAWVKKNKIEVPDIGLLWIDECFPGDVEILTEDGWTRFDALGDQRVAQYEHGKLLFVQPEEVIHKPYRGDLVRLNCNRLLDLAMTPQHQLLQINGRTGVERKIAAEEAIFNQSWNIQAAGYAEGDDRELTPGERLMIVLQADGSFHNKSHTSASFSFSKERKIERFLALVGETGLVCHEIKGKASKNPKVKSRRRFIVQGMVGATKYIGDHFNLATMSYQLARRIIAEMVEWDGHRHSDTSWYYSCVDERNVDFYQAVAVLGGYKTNKTVQHDDRKATYSDVHRLFITLNKSYFGTQSIKRERVSFDGMVHCVRVPSGNIVVRSHGLPVVIGNCHRAMGNRFQRIIEAYQERGSMLMGTTATPIRTDGVGLGQSFKSMVKTPGIKWHIEHGYLVPITYRIGIVPDTNGVKLTAGDYNQAQLEAVMKQKLLIGNVVENWLHHANGRPTMVFCSGVEHSKMLVKEFEAAGVRAAHIDGYTDQAVRDDVAMRLSMRTVDVVCNAQVYVEGTDIPCVSCIVLAQPTKSIGKYLQMAGRGLRPDPGSGKTSCMILDHAGAVYAHGLIEQERDWILTEGKEMIEKQLSDRKKEKVQFTCKVCGTLHTGALCPTCHAAVQFTGAARDYLPAMLVDMSQGEFDKLMAPKPVEKKKKNEYTKADKQDFYAQLLGHAAAYGMKQGWVSHKYREKFGVWPTDVSNIMPKTPGSEVRGFIRSRNIAFHKSRSQERVHG